MAININLTKRLAGKSQPEYKEEMLVSPYVQSDYAAGRGQAPVAGRIYGSNIRSRPPSTGDVALNKIFNTGRVSNSGKPLTYRQLDNETQRRSQSLNYLSNLMQDKTQRRGQDLSATTQRRGQDLSYETNNTRNLLSAERNKLNDARWNATYQQREEGNLARQQTNWLKTTSDPVMWESVLTPEEKDLGGSYTDMMKPFYNQYGVTPVFKENPNASYWTSGDAYVPDYEATADKISQRYNVPPEKALSMVYGFYNKPMPAPASGDNKPMPAPASGDINTTQIEQDPEIQMLRESLKKDIEEYNAL